MSLLAAPSRLARLVVAVSIGCGARTGLDTPDAAAFAASPDAPPGPSASQPEPDICSRNLGPVSSCDTSGAAGPIGYCSADFPHCVRPNGLGYYVCCSGGPPYNGPSGSCFGGGGQGAWPCPSFQAHVPVAGASGAATQCLPVLPLDNGLAPDCFVAVARFPTGTGTKAQIQACQQCSDPGLFVPPTEIPLASVGADLTSYACVCLVREQATLACAEGSGDGSFEWCFVDDEPTCHGPAMVLQAPPTFSGNLYVACFDD